MQDTYKEVREFRFPNMVARVHIPELSPQERAERMREIHKQVANLLKGADQ